MVNAIQLPVERQWFEENRLPESTFLGRLADHAGTTAGTSQLISVAKKTSDLAIEVLPNSYPKVLEDVSRYGGSALSGLSLVKLPKTTFDAFDAIRGSFEGGVLAVLKAVEASFKAIKSWCGALALITFNKAFRSMNGLFSIVIDITQLPKSIRNYCKARFFAGRVNGFRRIALDHSRNYYFRKMVECIVSVSIPIIAAVAAVLGYCAAPWALILAPLVTTIMTIEASLYKNSGKYKVITF